ncbi:Rho guanine nucleotide exchange factor, partial [Marasmius crinis-equi]
SILSQQQYTGHRPSTASSPPPASISKISPPAPASNTLPPAPTSDTPPAYPLPISPPTSDTSPSYRMTDVDTNHVDEEQLDKVWTGYDAGSLNPTTATADNATLKSSNGRRRSQNRPLPPTPGSATSSPVSTLIGAWPSAFPEEGGYKDVIDIMQFQGSDDGENFWNGSKGSDDESRFINYSLLSHIAVQLKDKVPHGTHVKGSIPYPRAFTGKDIVSTIQSFVQRELANNHNISTSDRRAAIQVARSLQSQLFFHEVEWGSGVLQDGVEDVYMFFDGPTGGEPAELPTGVVTVLIKCYAPDCVDGSPCYSPRCPRQGDTIIGPAQGGPESVTMALKEDWSKAVPIIPPPPASHRATPEAFGSGLGSSSSCDASSASKSYLGADWVDDAGGKNVCARSRNASWMTTTMLETSSTAKIDNPATLNCYLASTLIEYR